jgi:hypothetical protein
LTPSELLGPAFPSELELFATCKLIFPGIT